MADSSRFKGWQFNESATGQDSLTAVYEVTYDSIPANPYVALARARAANNEPVPPYRDQYATLKTWMFAQSFSAASHRDDGSCALIRWNVTYAPPPPGESEDRFKHENPLDRPPKINVVDISEEVPIESARNVQALAKALDGANRAADTAGPIVNAAGDAPVSPFVRTKRWEVIVIEKNYPSLEAIVSRNRTFKDTTNSDQFKNYEARELEYQTTRSMGESRENGTTFWPGVTEIIARPTDLTVDNVGYNYWDGANKVRAQVQDADTGENIDSPEPVNLALAGGLSGAGTTQITYRYLTETAYAGLLS